MGTEIFRQESHLVLNLHPHRGACIDRGGAAKAPEALPTILIDGFVCCVVPVLLGDLQDAIFLPRYIIYERIGCYPSSSPPGMYLF
ncbi:hypothetical protein B0H17DRAFT_1213108 [Mycena rosella]|uniref:Uncharacterized protein n=1 Tax=Mycena rosella TaxID=1033263 RepID=A0AAD7CQV9_MYCRO|nr:hypothetical protein B0H17DRAFT_1213108 [Mycena rosella]